MGVLAAYERDQTGPDFVWDSMIDYWRGTGQLDGYDGDLDSAGLNQSEFDGLGYYASYGTNAPGVTVVDDGRFAFSGAWEAANTPVEGWEQGRPWY